MNCSKCGAPVKDNGRYAVDLGMLCGFEAGAEHADELWGRVEELEHLLAAWIDGETQYCMRPCHETLQIYNEAYYAVKNRARDIYDVLGNH